ncbi:sugar O-acetyltransferase [Bifidobacterium sp. 82T24]|uniref:sugar O-acetyltransferase n=1 Tax=Bifidobacterium pluvialisilvae TaxID=2834436 RepID=UPI001C572146|nr:sugar O-acetyltransferase [Bifidobacterium pluvialisilvae]MBW3088200.1 sugar O-acetyltransferase [Bifidobacterium pluvialisilvae]
MPRYDVTADLTAEGRIEWERMVSGEVYQDSHPEIERKRAEAKRLFVAYNRTDYEDVERRREIMERLFASVGDDVFIEPNFRCEIGRNISIGSHAYINFDCVMLDNAPITLGDYVWIAPMVGLFATNHALDFEERKAGACRARPIVIGDGVWLGGHVTVLGGVTIGRGSVIGAGSVVTRDIPEGVVAVGNPARVVRTITEKDRTGFLDRLAARDSAREGA